MTDALPVPLVSSAVFAAFAAGLPEPTPTLYPGTTGDTAHWSEWYEVWVDQQSPRVQRRGAPELCDLRVTVHVYVKPTLEKARVAQLAASAQQILNGQTIAIQEFSASDSLLGYIKLGIGQVRELTRLDADAQRHGLQHQVIVWTGLAQRLLLV